MTPAIYSLIILAICVVLFITEALPIATVSILGCAAMVIFGVCDLKTVLSAFSGEVAPLMFGMMVVGNALFASGILDRVGKFIARLSHNKERRFLLYVCLFCFAAGWFLNNSSIIILMLTICSGLSASSDIRLKNLAMPIAISAICGGHCTLIGFATQLAASGMLQNATGESFSMFCLAKVALPVSAMVMLYIMFPGYKIGQKIWGNRRLASDEPDPAAAAMAEKEIPKATVVKVIAIMSVILFLFVTELFSAGVTAMIGAALVIALKIIPEKEAFSKVNWSSIIWMCGCLGIGNAVSAGGGAEIIGKALFAVFGGVKSPMLLLMAMSLVAMLLSQVMNNATALLVVLPATLSMVIDMGYNAYPFAYAMCLTAGITFLTPLANGNIALTVVAGYKFMDYVKYSFIPTVVAFFIIVFLTPVFYPLVG